MQEDSTISAYLDAAREVDVPEILLFIWGREESDPSRFLELQSSEQPVLIASVIKRFLFLPTWKKSA